MVDIRDFTDGSRGFRAALTVIAILAPCASFEKTSPEKLRFWILNTPENHLSGIVSKTQLQPELHDSRIMGVHRVQEGITGQAIRSASARS